MNRRLNRTVSLLLAVVLTASLVLAGVSAYADEGDVAAVTALLEQIDSLQEMQDKRAEWTVSAGYEPDEPDPDVMAEHDLAISEYAAYVADMNAKRAEAQAAYDDLTDGEREQLDPVLVAKLTDTLENTFNPGPYPLEPRDDEYHYQIVQISERRWLGYELSTHMSVDRDMPCTLVIADTSTDAESIILNGLYEYGTNNYELTYCCDELQPTTYLNHYRRINLEDCDYYNSYQASKIRAIILNSYPFVSLETMKANLKAGGLACADDLDRSDITAAVQFAVWYFSNRMTNEELERDTSYGSTGMTLDYPRPGARLISSVNDYRNEIWYWYSSNARQMSYHEDLEERVMALRDYLIGLPGVEADAGSIVISSVEIVRTDMVPGEGDTYTLSLNVVLNHGAGGGDEVTLEVTTFYEDEEGEIHVTGTETADVTGETVYPLTVTARYGDTVHVEVNGTQDLEKAVYFYQPEGGYEASQSLVGVAEGTTRVHAEDEFVFTRDIEAGLRIYKTEKDTGKPMEGIVFDVYRVETEEGETLSETPTEEEIARFAVDENKAASAATDESGYAAVELPEGTYLLIEEHDPSKSRAPIEPMYFTLPVETEKLNEDGTIEVTYGPVLSLKLTNEPPDEPGSVSFRPAVTKEINDWGDAESFTFRLEAVTEGAPMPSSDTAVATRENLLAEFGRITYYEEGVYEYTITEVDDGVLFVTYDTEPHSLTVTVTEVPGSLHQEFEIEVSYDGEESLTIANRYEVIPVEAEIKVTKDINDWGEAWTFTFDLAAVTEGAPMPENETAVATRAKPLAEFGTVSFDKEGVYEYTITERDDGIEYVTYDTEPHAVVITVTKGKDGLEAAVTYDGEPDLTITNTHIPETGDVSVPALYALLGALCAAALAFLKRRNQVS